MKILSLETSSKHFSLAVSDGEKILKSCTVVLKKVLSSSIIPGINSILKSSGVKLSQLDGFAVGLGPGSFTSLRVGVSTVKALAFALQKPVVGIPSLDILAMNVEASEGEEICAICDAKRNLVYACLYEKTRIGLKRKSPYLLTNITEVLSIITGKVIFVGDGISLFREELVQKNKASFADEKKGFPQAKRLAVLAVERFKNKEFSDVDELVPMYLYPEDCQVGNKK